jgi:hypothetical protein
MGAVHWPALTVGAMATVFYDTTMDDGSIHAASRHCGA